MINAVGFDVSTTNSYYSVPPLPVRLFKELRLTSVPEADIFKVLTSSGTTGQAVSKVCLDKETSTNQQKVLTKIITSYLGSSRLPMIILDCPSVVRNTARGAGILGFSIFGGKRIYALDDDMNLNVEAVRSFLDQHRDEKILLFGYTFMVWQHFYKALINIDNYLELSNSVLFHVGGWKKMVSQGVNSVAFKRGLNEVCGISEVHDYYGMAEQLGSIYVECECGHLHASVFSDVITRRANDLSVCDFGEVGIIEVVSPLPKSYPGHALLTEDARPFHKPLFHKSIFVS
jgi:hypothetical protein